MPSTHENIKRRPFIVVKTQEVRYVKRVDGKNGEIYTDYDCMLEPRREYYSSMIDYHMKNNFQP